MSKLDSLSSYHRTNLQVQTIDFIKIGMSPSFIFYKIAKPLEFDYDDFFHNIYKVSLNDFKNNVNIQRDYVLGLHFIRYSEKIEDLINVDVSMYTDIRRQNIARQNAYNDCLDFIKNKEKLIGFHSRDFKTRIKEYMPEVIKDDPFSLDGLDINKLTLDEKREFLTLLDKAKTKQDNKIKFIKKDNDDVPQVLPNSSEIKKLENNRRFEEALSSLDLIKTKSQNKNIQRKTAADLLKIYEEKHSNL